MLISRFPNPHVCFFASSYQSAVTVYRLLFYAVLYKVVAVYMQILPASVFCPIFQASGGSFKENELGKVYNDIAPYWQENE
jgi:hypothetical protein